LTAYGNGYCVKFIRMKAWWLLAVYQGFCLGWDRVALGTVKMFTQLISNPSSHLS
jgi:hypothetical protein